MNKISRYFKEVKQELMKVSWPKKSQVINDTVSVLATVVISIAFLAAADFLFSKLANLILIGEKI